MTISKDIVIFTYLHSVKFTYDYIYISLRYMCVVMRRKGVSTLSLDLKIEKIRTRTHLHQFPCNFNLSHLKFGRYFFQKKKKNCQTPPPWNSADMRAHAAVLQGIVMLGDLCLHVYMYIYICMYTCM